MDDVEQSKSMHYAITETVTRYRGAISTQFSSAVLTAIDCGLVLINVLSMCEIKPSID